MLVTYLLANGRIYTGWLLSNGTEDQLLERKQSIHYEQNQTRVKEQHYRASAKAIQSDSSSLKPVSHSISHRVRWDTAAMTDGKVMTADRFTT